ncbi:MAG: hypothetical protein ACYDDU_09805 [Dermatophilaceae bacterium]
MSRFERDQDQPIDSSVDPARDAPAPLEPSSEADESAAHIAALVRRTTERHGAPGPSPVAHPDATLAQAPPMPTSQIAPPEVSQIAPPDSPKIARPNEETSRHAMWQPSRRILAAAGILFLVVVGGGVALSHPFGSGTAAHPTTAPGTAAPASYTVKVTDVITDCAGHSRGQAQVSFKAENCVKATRLLATGVVGGRPVLFVVSRIEMATGEAAASVKQVLDGNGTGNLNDLLREGKTYPGAPHEMPISGYASLQKGTVVTVAEAGFVDDGRSSSSDPALRSAAADVAEMVSTRG